MSPPRPEPTPSSPHPGGPADRSSARESSFAVFDTAIGRCAIGWSQRGIRAVQLPEADETRTRARMHRHVPDAREQPAPPAHVQRVITDIRAVLHGQTRELSQVVLDMDRVPPFHRRVYEITRTIAPGTTLSYGEVADRLGAPGSARAVGQALGRNPFAIVVPCHRVLTAAGAIGGFSAHGGAATKLRLLRLEHAQIVGVSTLFDLDDVFGSNASVATDGH